MRIHVRTRSRTTPGQRSLMGLLVALVGGGFAIAGLFQASQTYQAISTSVKVTGTVVRFATRNSSNQPMYYAVVRYSTRGGQVEEITDGVGTNQPRFGIGDHVNVLYTNEHPDQGRIDDPMSLWFLPALESGLGAVALLAGGGLFGTGLSNSFALSTDQPGRDLH